MEQLVRLALRGDEKRIAEILLVRTGADGILWLAGGDRLLSVRATERISRATLDEEAYLLVDTLQHRHGMAGAPAYIEVDVDELTGQAAGAKVAWRRVLPALDGDECLGGFMLFAATKLEVREPDLAEAALAFSVAFKLRGQQRTIDNTADRLERLSEMGRIIGAGGEITQTISRILELAIRASGAEVGALVHFDRNETPVVTGMDPSIFESIRFKKEGSLLERVLQIESEMFFTGERLRQDLDLVSATMVIETLVLLPLLYEGRRLGAMILINQPAAQIGDETDRAALVTMAHLAAAVMVAEEEQADRLEQERTRQELKAACSIQQSLLPKRVPVVSGLLAAGRSRPSRSVGGDFYDIFQLDENRLGVMIADVSGMGIPASLLMAIARSYMRVAALEHRDSPAAALAKLNRLLCGEIADNKFITANYAIFDTANERALLANAGHHPPLLVHTDGLVKHIDADGLPLGIFSDSVYRDVGFDFARGMSIFFYTDGLIEIRNSLGQPLGSDRLREYLAGASRLAPDALLEMMWQKTMAFSAAHEPADDWTSVIVQYSEIGNR